jgi:hypothetical protein
LKKCFILTRLVKYTRNHGEYDFAAFPMLSSWADAPLVMGPGLLALCASLDLWEATVDIRQQRMVLQPSLTSLKSMGAGF